NYYLTLLIHKQCFFISIKPKLSEAQEKEKAQALNQLKNLGNTILGKFGLSMDNFKITQDPQTKGYSVSFQK
ncbi:hypothetical protein PCK1_000990, partial [Pneumocystis canis]